MPTYERQAADRAKESLEGGHKDTPLFCKGVRDVTPGLQRGQR